MKLYRKDIKMTLKHYIIAGVIEQVIMLGFITPATGWWFSFFALSAVWNLVAGGFREQLMKLKDKSGGKTAPRL